MTLLYLLHTQSSSSSSSHKKRKYIIEVDEDEEDEEDEEEEDEQDDEDEEEVEEEEEDDDTPALPKHTKTHDGGSGSGSAKKARRKSGGGDVTQMSDREVLEDQVAKIGSASCNINTQLNACKYVVNLFKGGCPAPCSNTSRLLIYICVSNSYVTVARRLGNSNATEGHYLHPREWCRK